MAGREIQGLGDAVALVAEPIAAVSDRVLRTTFKGCAGCARRRAWLNRYVPLRRGSARDRVSTVDEKPT
jgi:hypothetical protein